MKRFLIVVLLLALGPMRLPAKETVEQRVAFVIPEGATYHEDKLARESERYSCAWTTDRWNDLQLSRAVKTITWPEVEAYAKGKHKEASEARAGKDEVKPLARIKLASKVVQGYEIKIFSKTAENFMESMICLWDRESLWLVRFSGHRDEYAKVLPFIESIRKVEAAPAQ